MTNWEAEANRLKSQQQFEANQKIETEKQAKLKTILSEEKRLQNEIENNYKTFILPGFEILDSFNIKETLTEIRDQVWKVGEVFKRPNNFEEYRLRSSYDYSCYPTNMDKSVTETRSNYNSYYNMNYKTLPPPENISQQEERFRINNFKESLLAKYILYTDTLICISAGHYTDGCPYSEEVEKSCEILTISSDGKNIYIYNDGDYNIKEKEYGNSINIEQNNKTKTENWIKEKLIKNCAQRRDYTKIDSEILKHPGLLEKYYDSLKPPKRSFLDRLFG